MLPPRFRRTALAVALCLLLTLLPTTARAAFSDVAPGSWYEDAVTQMEAKNILNGYADGTFRPNAAVTREQAAAILYRYAKSKGIDVSVGENTNILSYVDVQ